MFNDMANYYFNQFSQLFHYCHLHTAGYSYINDPELHLGLKTELEFRLIFFQSHSERPSNVL